MSAIGLYLNKYDISYYGIILCVGIGAVELDTYLRNPCQIFGAGKWRERKK